MIHYGRVLLTQIIQWRRKKSRVSDGPGACVGDPCL